MHRLQVIARIPDEMLDMEGDAVILLLADDMLRTVSRAIKQLRKQAKENGRKPSEECHAMFMHANMPIIVEESGNVTLGLNKWEDSPELSEKAGTEPCEKSLREDPGWPWSQK